MRRASVIVAVIFTLWSGSACAPDAPAADGQRGGPWERGGTHYRRGAGRPAGGGGWQPFAPVVTRRIDDHLRLRRRARGGRRRAWDLPNADGQPAAERGWARSGRRSRCGRPTGGGSPTPPTRAGRRRSGSGRPRTAPTGSLPGSPRAPTASLGRPTGSGSPSPGDRFGNMDIWTVSVPEGKVHRLTSDLSLRGLSQLDPPTARVCSTCAWTTAGSTTT